MCSSDLSASAELVTVACTGVGAGRNVTVTHMGSARSVFAGQILLTLTNSASGSLNGNWKSFCTELNQYIYVNGAPQVYDALDVSEHGARIEVGCMIPEGMTGTAIAHQPSGVRIDRPAMVVWCRAVRDDRGLLRHYEAGVR